jgi:hypothetical protein
VLAALQQFVPLAPLHQPHNLLPIARLLQRRPDVPQVACFDTAFHATTPDVEQRFALPEALHDAGVRRYGFHGLSYEYIASVLPAHDARAAGRSPGIWATAPACARCGPVAASPRRWASRRSTDCRWAPARARSIPGCCCG